MDFACEVASIDDLPAPPPDGYGGWGVVDLDDFVVARAVDASVLNRGFDAVAFSLLVDDVMQTRTEPYDFVVVVHTDAMPDAMDGAAAFNLSYNNTDAEGTGAARRSNSRVPVYAALWMNSLDYWDAWGLDATAWVFAQELSHQWLFYPSYDDGDGASSALLGRQSAHWSYFADTPNSPAEGNAWIDNGDGTFTTDLSVAPAFAPLDLYLMGFVGRDEVPPFFYIVPDDDAHSPADTPQHLWSDEPVTISGTRVDVTVDDVIAAEGERTPGPQDSPRDFRVLMVLALTPSEPLTSADVGRVLELESEWVAAWDYYAGDYSSVAFTVAETARRLPDPPAAPALIPRAAW